MIHDLGSAPHHNPTVIQARMAIRPCQAQVLQHTTPREDNHHLARLQHVRPSQALSYYSSPLPRLALLSGSLIVTFPTTLETSVLPPPHTGLLDHKARERAIVLHNISPQATESPINAAQMAPLPSTRKKIYGRRQASSTIEKRQRQWQMPTRLLSRRI